MSSGAVDGALLGASLAATVAGGLRWLRVAQREHYLPGSTIRFARRWWSLGPNRLLGGAAVAGLVAAAFGAAPAGLVAAAAVGCGPLGLTLRGRTAKLAWTRRLRTLAVASGAMVIVPVGAGLAVGGLAFGAAVATLLAVATPLVVDLALLATVPVERRLAAPYVARASARLGVVRPSVVAVTGSYGKTSTKGHIAHLVGGTLTVVPTPASFNNSAGLARAVNEHLVAGTDVFVAEMGTYGPGEIAAMCRWCPPDIAVITAIGPVHLERMGSEDRILAAKAEIVEQARVVVLNVDDPRLAALADRVEGSGRRVWRCSATDPAADVCVRREDDGLRVLVAAHRAGAQATPARDPVGAPGTAGREPVTGLDRSPAVEVTRGLAVDPPPTNLAVAVAVAMELGVPLTALAARLPTLPATPFRRQVTTGRTGATIIDDTYNSNPAGAAAALDLLERLGADGHRRVVVTPGMVELGARQAEENTRFAGAAAQVATDVVIVGRSNARALLDGATGAGGRVRRVATREQAVAWVAARAGPGDVVLYENDLPDHFP